MTDALRIATIGLSIGLAISCGGSSKKPGCEADKDCTGGLVCAAHKCVACTTDAQCEAGQRCEANACVAKPRCTSDAECTNGQICQAGACKPCATDDECGPGGSCSAGACQPGKKCGKDEDCADDEDCVAGVCKRAGAAEVPADVPCTLATVYFRFDDASIQASERDRLQANASCIEKVSNHNVYLFGHTDSSGTDEYNIALSERRAQTVADYLSRLGVDPARLQVVPKGETEPSGLGDDRDRRCELQWQ